MAPSVKELCRQLEDFDDDTEVKVLTETPLEDGEVGVITKVSYNHLVGAVTVHIDGADHQE